MVIAVAPDATRYAKAAFVSGDLTGRAPPVSTSVIISMCKNPRKRCRAAYVLQAPSSIGTYSAHGPGLGDQGQKRNRAGPCISGNVTNSAKRNFESVPPA